MNSDITDNKYALLNLRLKYNWLIISSIILFSLIIFSSIYYKTYDSYIVTGTHVNRKINITLLASEAKNILESEYLKINNQKYKFSIESVSAVEFEVTTNSVYQNITISTSGNFLDNEILELTFYKNKQRIIKKIINLLK